MYLYIYLFLWHTTVSKPETQIDSLIWNNFLSKANCDLSRSPSSPLPWNKLAKLALAAFDSTLSSYQHIAFPPSRSSSSKSCGEPSASHCIQPLISLYLSDLAFKRAIIRAYSIAWLRDHKKETKERVFVAPRTKKMTSEKVCRAALWVGVMTNYDTLTGEDELLLVFVEMRCWKEAQERSREISIKCNKVPHMIIGLCYCRVKKNHKFITNRNVTMQKGEF